MKRVFISAVTGSLIASAVMAQNQAPAQGDDPPGRAARLSYISGTVSFQPGSVEDWVPATLNRPMTTGDRLWTEAGARAEMHIGSAAVRLNGRTSLAVMNLDDRTTQIQVSTGVASVRLRRLADDESFEIDTPQLALTLLRPGDYRVEVNEQGETTIVGVRGGEAEANAGAQAVTVHPRDQIRVMGTDQPVFDTRVIPAADAFDNWCQERDRREDMSVSGTHVSRDIPGYADLDGNGTWGQSPDYGWVWAPTAVPPGWAPYHSGHWAWIAPWGWTWVDDAPWGYAPFHYGRWVFVAGGWAWVPGPIVPRPVYAPAMVAWIGGPSVGVGIAVGVGPAVGWFPLGPREVWVPAYHYSPVYLERVNVTNTVIVNRTVITNVNVTNVTYMNRNVAGAVTVVPQSAMTVGRPVATAAIRVPPDAVARAEVRNVAVVAPERSAVLGGRVQTSAAPPAAVVSRTVVARGTPPPPAPSFAQQQQALRQNPGQPIPRSSLAQVPGASTGGSPQPAVRQIGTAPPTPVQTARPAAPVTPQSEFRRQPSPQTTQQTPAAQQPQFQRTQVPQQPQQSAAPIRQQPQQSTPQSSSQPELRPNTSPSTSSAPANQGSTTRSNEKQKGRQEKQEKDGKRHEEKN